MRISDWSSDVCSSDLELGKGAGAVAHGFLPGRVHLAEGDGKALGLEHRIEAEAALAADRPDQGALDAPFEGGGGAVGPGDREGAAEEGAAVRTGAELPVNPPHGDEEVALRPRPAGGVNANRKST